MNDFKLAGQLKAGKASEAAMLINLAISLDKIPGLLDYDTESKAVG